MGSQLDDSLESVLEAKVNENTSDIEYRMAN
ncbi:hypothetical protein WBP_0066 [Wolbachia endosymbiont of Brugia pahangi]|nr:hypothetical protein WBP_0066 [Wolbachia endosymbiont of Brugia pahangi]